MAIFDSKDRIRKWKYHVAEIHLLIPGSKAIKIPAQRLNSMTISEDYETMCFPLFKIQLILESSVYYKILKNKDKCQLQLKIYKYYHSTDSSKRSAYKSFINQKFDLIYDEATDDMLNSLKEKENKTDYKKRIKNDENDISKVDNAISFYLFRSEVDGTKNNVNKILTGCNITDAICYLLSQANIKNVLMAQPDNRQIYDELIIPLMSITKAFQFLDTYYGLYNEGSMIYFGLKYTYILPYSGKCKAYVQGEITETDIIIPKSSKEAHANNLGDLFKNKKSKINYIVADYKSMDISNNSVSNDYISANDIQAVDSYSGLSTTQNSGATTKGNNFIKAFENRTENGMLASAYAAQSKAESVVISINMEDYDMDTIQPNKKIAFLFEDSTYTKKYKGSYIVSSLVHSFISEGDDFAISTTGVFKRTDK